jgi:hypothetical protein
MLTDMFHRSEMPVFQGFLAMRAASESWTKVNAGNGSVFTKSLK